MEKFSENDQLEIRSPEVQEIIGNAPHSIVRWGITVILLVILTLLSISWFIRYPDLLTAAVTLTTTPPPITIVSRINGNLIMLVPDNKPVQEGELLGYIRSNASPEAVIELEKKVKGNHDLSSEPVHGSLGDLQSPYANVITALKALQRFVENQSYPLQITHLKKQATTNQKLKKALRYQQLLILQEQALAKEKFKTDSILFKQRVTASLDFNQAHTVWLQQQRTARNAETALLNNETQLNELNRQITDLEIKMVEEQQKLELTLSQTQQEVLARITKWKETYLLITPTTGTVAYLGFLEKDQYIEPNKAMVTIIPAGGRLVARGELPLRSSGKVKEGQAVNIRLENYPFEQFGMLKGVVSAISSLPKDGKYLLTIELPHGLITTQKRKLEFKQQLSGSTQIITEDLRLLERFTYQFSKLVQAR